MTNNHDGFPGIWKQLRMNLKARARLRRQQVATARNRQLKYVTQEQLSYAKLLDTGVAIGTLLLIVTFVPYVFGIAAPKVAFSDLPTYWSMSVDEYLQVVGIGIGWSWLTLTGYGDYMNFLGIAFLCSLTPACYLRVLPIALRRQDFVFSTILILEVIVLVFAASGLLAVAH
jgi:hypothetical protein